MEANLMLPWLQKPEQKFAFLHIEIWDRFSFKFNFIKTMFYSFTFCQLYTIILTKHLIFISQPSLYKIKISSLKNSKKKSIQMVIWKCNIWWIWVKPFWIVIIFAWSQKKPAFQCYSNNLLFLLLFLFLKNETFWLPKKKCCGHLKYNTFFLFRMKLKKKKTS